jgi:hypothetical protein
LKEWSFIAVDKRCQPHWPKRLLKKAEKQIPRGLKPARNDKNKGLCGTSKVLAEKRVTLSERPVLPRVEGPL